MRFQLATNPDELAPLAEAFEALAEELGWDAAAAMHINLAVEELVTNIINYGYSDGRVGRIEVWLEADPEEVRLCIEDDADPFDPFAMPEPDHLTQSLEERPIGGLGIHFVRSYMDVCTYYRLDNNCNQVRLVKRLR
jgi:anti-sigma regulatory factor (Ser/Thr protein kinase)